MKHTPFQPTQISVAVKVLIMQIRQEWFYRQFLAKQAKKIRFPVQGTAADPQPQPLEK